MYRLIILFFIAIFSYADDVWNGSFYELRPVIEPIGELEDGWCLERVKCYDPVTTNYEGSSSIGYYFRYQIKEPATSSQTYDYNTCSGPSIDSASDPIPKSAEFGSVSCTEKSFDMSKKTCSDVNQNFDGCGNEIVYVNGVPMSKSDIENALYFDDYQNLLICNSHYLQINNSMCLMPNVTSRNLADAILKRDKIVRENNLTDVSGINENSIVYDDNGGIVSYSFSAMDENGAISMVGVTFSETDPVFTVEEDGSITESEYVPNTDNTSGSTTGDSSSSGDTSTDGLTDEIYAEMSENNRLTSQINDSLTNINASSTSSNQKLTSIESYMEDLVNPELPDLDNPLENADSYYDDSVIPQVEEMVTNLTNDFNSLKDTYTEKIAYIKENGFEFDYSSQLYETCPLNFTLNPFKDVDNETLTDEEFSLNIDICSLMANAKLPNSEMSLLSIFYVIFYSFFYAVILIGIFKLAALTFRSF